jgi:tetratricopeptide (TPR) repeat protein
MSVIKIAPLFFLIGQFLIPAVSSWASENPDIQALLSQAGSLYDQRDEHFQTVENAEKLYKQVLAVDSSNFEALWHAARCYWWMGDHALQAQRIALFDEGKALAEKAQKAAPDKTEGYYWAGVCLGRAAEERGVLNSLFAINDIVGFMAKDLALNPKDGGAQHVLGVLYRKAPGWPLSRGDMKKSLEYARAAVANRPDVVLYSVGLAETLIAMNQKDEAKTVLKKALDLPGPADLQPETKEQKEKAIKVLATLK